MMTPRLLPALIVSLILLSACTQPGPPPDPDLTPEDTTETLSEQPPASPDRSVIVHLFEWTWTDIAQECETFLGPAGYRAVQVSPPTENAVVEDPPRPWWERYQPVTYRLDNRSGTRAQFADMVSRCKAAGVDIYVDAILNHMTGVYAGAGTAGATFSEYDYPGLYTTADFHHCGLTPNDDIQDFNDRMQVQTCELVNLADLDTGAEKVQARLAEYLNDLIGLGVAGFRLDAARHVAADELKAILDRLDGDPFIYQEVIDLAQQPTWALAYTPLGSVTEFRYGAALSDVFRNGPLTRLHGDGSIWQQIDFLPSDRALVFIDNHDNQRGHGAGGSILTYKDNERYTLAVVFMLAYPYGRPRVMSSYAFTESSQGPPADAASHIQRVHEGGTLHCFADAWICEHRRSPVAAMVAFHNVTDEAFGVANWWDNGNNQIAFGRGDRGFVVINRENGALNRTLQTGLAPGTYCNVLAGALADDGQGCTGPAVTVGADGAATLAVEPMSALAIHVGAKVGG